MALMYLIIFIFLIKLFNSSFVLILHVPSLSFIDQNIFLNIFLPVINNFLSLDSCSTHVSLSCVITGKPGTVNGKTYDINVTVTCLA